MTTSLTSQGIDFGHALAAAKQGKRIARAGWNGKNMFVFQRPADELSVDFILTKVKSLPDSLKAHFAEYNSAHDMVKFTAYLCMLAADGSIVNGWQPSQTDMQATDWEVSGE
jgi:hypothetical protein